jgi:hypothetical protein
MVIALGLLSGRAERERAKRTIKKLLCREHDREAALLIVIELHIDNAGSAGRSDAHASRDHGCGRRSDQSVAQGRSLMLVPLITPAALAGPPMAPVLVPGRIMLVPLMPAFDLGRTAGAAPTVGRATFSPTTVG